MEQQALPGRSPTFVVDSDRQRGTLNTLVRREQHFAEDYTRNKPLCFNAKAYQKTHPTKALKGDPDADATLCSPMIVAVADGVSQIEEFGINASELPNELLGAIEELAVCQLLPGQETEEYAGPISMMKDAYESTSSLGSTTVLTAIMDNSTKIHGKLHPMIAVCSIGDCEILILRRMYDGSFSPVFHTEMQRIDGNAQSPLQLARVDETVDPSFDESIAIEVIEHGSAVHCVSALLGDIVVAGSDGVFDNLFIDDIVDICQNMIPHSPGGNKSNTLERRLLGEIARCIVSESHAKTQKVNGKFKKSPIGLGGKVDDTACVVAQVVEWTDEYGDAWAEMRSQRWWHEKFSCNSLFGCRDQDSDMQGYGTHKQNYPAKPSGESFSTYWGSFSLDNSQGMPQSLQMVMPRREVPEPKRKVCNDEGCSIM